MRRTSRGINAGGSVKGRSRNFWFMYRSIGCQGMVKEPLGRDVQASETEAHIGRLSIIFHPKSFMTD
jgi:hypothetical protein